MNVWLVCLRVIRAIRRELKNSESSAKYLDRYCSLKQLPVDEQKFCYNTDTIRRELVRLIDMGADENRVCKKLNSINPDFCTSKLAETSSLEASKDMNKNKKRGIIYEWNLTIQNIFWINRSFSHLVFIWCICAYK